MAGKNRNTFEKMQREAQKKRKAEAKRERRQARKDAPRDEVPAPTPLADDTTGDPAEG